MIASNNIILVIKSKFKNILLTTWGMMLATDHTWQSTTFDIENKKFSMKDFVFPWITILTIFSFIFNGIYSNQNFFKTAFIEGFITFIALLSTFYFVKYITTNFVTKRIKDNHINKKIEFFVSYSMVIIFVLKFVVVIIPSLFFLQILSVYTAFVVWEGINVFFKLDEDDRGKLMLMVSAAIVISPLLIDKVISLMVN